MFRRFMIVCWVLFATLSVTYIFGAVSHNHHTSNILDLRRQSMIEDQLDSPYHIRVGLKGFLAAFKADERLPPWARYWDTDGLETPTAQEISRPWMEVLVDIFVDSNYSPDAQEAWDDDPRVSDIEAIKKFSDNEFETAYAEAKENYLNALDSSKKINAFRNWKSLFGGLAILMLMWNIFCHTSHWIWRGRKAS